MNIIGHLFDESNSGHKSECYSCSSPETSFSNLPNTANSDEEALTLASARPKKRAGRRIFKETRHPVYRGVRRRNNNRWVCEVRVPNDKSTRIWLGTYPTPEMAARAHDVAALTLRGKSACLNFADSAWRLPLPASTNAKEIRRVAAEAAMVFAGEHESVNNGVADCEVNSSGVSVSEDGNTGALQGLSLHNVDEVPRVTKFEDLHDWLRCMADEPLRSPPPSVRYSRDWDVVEDDAEVSLWTFTV
ncbi:dehydration-responsive element-binding protein 1E-like [Abrus precatorius]|uniref:Dehydration-responsive element-binding protein 1E-like n=1 Tax=Abrus precatorius TaxID=3816 RepID=A0A8B8JZU0_ABRPR|nr:dehydration-responsive element-binding protein 1E-like [Abrus precatorius]